jgi:type IV secretion system protein VirB9
MNGAVDIPTGNFPAIFGRDREDGEDFVVNTTVENDTVVVHGTYPYLVIRHGRDVVALRRNSP